MYVWLFRYFTQFSVFSKHQARVLREECPPLLSGAVAFILRGGDREQLKTSIDVLMSNILMCLLNMLEAPVICGCVIPLTA